VQIFELYDHPQATRAYAWMRAATGRLGERPRPHVVAGTPPINDACAAVLTLLHER
jgi:hypothetical protein